MLDQVLGRTEIEPRINCIIASANCPFHRVVDHQHSWMMLSKRITENRRLLTAAPAIKQRIMTRSSPRVLGPLACFRNWLSCAAAMLERKVMAERKVLLARPRHGARRELSCSRCPPSRSANRRQVTPTPMSWYCLTLLLIVPSHPRQRVCYLCDDIVFLDTYDPVLTNVLPNRPR
jgi:hypothetical protein